MKIFNLKSEEKEDAKNTKRNIKRFSTNLLERFLAFNNTCIKIPRDFVCFKYLDALAKTVLNSPQ